MGDTVESRRERREVLTAGRTEERPQHLNPFWGLFLEPADVTGTSLSVVAGSW